MENSRLRARPSLPSYQELMSKRCYSSASDGNDPRPLSAIRTPDPSRPHAMRTQSASSRPTVQFANGNNSREVVFSSFNSGQQKPPKPPRKGKANGIYFPAIIEHPGNHYASCGYFGDFGGIDSNRLQNFETGPQKTKFLRERMGSTPNLVDFKSWNSKAAIRTMRCDDDDGLSEREKCHQYGMQTNTINKIPTFIKPLDKDSSPRKVASIDSLARPPVDFLPHSDQLYSLNSNYRGSLDYLRPSSVSSSGNMSDNYKLTRIRTNGSFQQLRQAQQQRQTPTLNNLPSPAEFVVTSKECRILNSAPCNSDHTDNVSVTSISSSLTGSQSESDSGKATSQNSGSADGTISHHEDTLCLMDDFGLGGTSPLKNANPLLPDVNNVPPWNENDIANVLEGGRLRSLKESGRLSSGLIPYLSRLLSYPFTCLCTEISRLAKSNHEKCTKRDIMFAAQRILPFNVFLVCKTACHQAGAFYASSLSGDQSRSSKSVHAGLGMDVGKMHGYLVRQQIAKFVQDLAAVYLTAIIQTILEEFILSSAKETTTEKNRAIRSVSASPDRSNNITCKILDKQARKSAQFIGLFYPWSHFPSEGVQTDKSDPAHGIYSELSGNKINSVEDLHDSIAEVSNIIEDSRKDRVRTSSVLEELTISQMFWSSDAMLALQYYLTKGHQSVYSKDHPPPLIEWLRIIEACAAYRRSSMIEKDDVMESARILLSSIDYPPHLLSLSDELQYFQAISKPRLLNDFNQAGLTPLMIACIRCDYPNVKSLITSGAKVNLSIPPMTSAATNSAKPSYTRIKPDIQNWTALHFAVSHGCLNIAKHLLDNGAFVEGSEGTLVCETPLQIAVAQGNDEMTALLLARGADPCLSSISEERSFGAEAQRGTQAALVLAAGHGRRKCLMKMLAIFSAPVISRTEDAMSLEEMLQEGGGGRNRTAAERRKSGTFSPPVMNFKPGQFHNKIQQKILNSAFYHAIENGFLELAVELSQAGALWRVHTWIRAISMISPENPFLKVALDGFRSLPLEEVIESPELTLTAVPNMFNFILAMRDQPSILMTIFRILTHLYGGEGTLSQQNYDAVNLNEVLRNYEFATSSGNAELERSSLEVIQRNLSGLYLSQPQLFSSLVFGEDKVLGSLESRLKEILNCRRKILGGKLHGSV